MSTPAAEPFYFGPPRQALFGWLHAPAEAHRFGDFGVVLCNPFGYESVCVHRTYRHIAERAAASGIAALRFDYHGTGDSSGDDYEDDRLRMWVSSVHAAVDELKSRTGVRRICLVGLRLGATLAALAAAGRDDINGLVAIAPVVKGRAFLRELRALALSRPQPTPPEWARVNTEIQEAAGFVLTAATQQALQETDVTQITRVPAPHVLLLDREELPGSAPWGAALESSGVEVERGTFSGYAAMMLSAHENTVPERMVGDVIRWIQKRATHGREVLDSLPPMQTDRETCSQPLDDVSETLVHVGFEPRLFGVLTESVTPSGMPRTATNVVLLLNAGAISRIGPGRLYVTLARLLARQGHAVFRMDISGIGDSAPHAGEPENTVYTSRAQADIKAAVAYLRDRFGDTPLHLMGICSGAFHGFKAAAAGVGCETAVIINPLTFFWNEGMKVADPEFHAASEVARYRSTALEAKAWLKLLRGQVDLRKLMRIFINRGVTLARHGARDVARRVGIPLSDDLARELQQATQAGTQLQFIFAAKDPGLQLLREQGGAAVQRLQLRHQLHIEIIEAADHTFTAHWARERLIGLLVNHLASNSREAAAA